MSTRANSTLKSGLEDREDPSCVEGYSPQTASTLALREGTASQWYKESSGWTQLNMLSKEQQQHGGEKRVFQLLEQLCTHSPRLILQKSLPVAQKLIPIQNVELKDNRKNLNDFLDRTWKAHRVKEIISKPGFINSFKENETVNHR